MSSCWSATDVAADGYYLPNWYCFDHFFVCLLAQQLEMLWDSFHVIFEMGKL